MKKPRFVWTEEYKQAARRLYAEGKTRKQVAGIIGCSVGAADRLLRGCERGKEAPQPVEKPTTITERKCIRCGTAIKSTWAGDRYCETCRRRAHSQSEGPDSFSIGRKSGRAA